MSTEQKNNELKHDLPKALYRLFHTEQPGDTKETTKDPLFNKRQRFKLSRALYFECDNEKESERKAYTKMQAAQKVARCV